MHYLALDMQQKAVDLLEEVLLFFRMMKKLNYYLSLQMYMMIMKSSIKCLNVFAIFLNRIRQTKKLYIKFVFGQILQVATKKAFGLHQKIIDQQPYSELAWFNLGSAYQGLKLYEKAIDAYQYAVAIDEKFDYAYRNMGDAYIRLEKI